LKLKKRLSEAESAQPSGPQPSRLQLMTYEEEVRRLKKEVAQKDVELSKKDLEVNILKQKLVEAESQGIAAQKISSENSTLREALEKMLKICGDALLEE
jgi:site-specific recombinase XerC